MPLEKMQQLNKLVVNYLKAIDEHTASCDTMGRGCKYKKRNATIKLNQIHKTFPELDMMTLHNLMRPIVRQYYNIQ